MKDKTEGNEFMKDKTEGNEFMQMIERLTVNPDVSAEKIKQIMELEERSISLTAKRDFNAAMSQAQSKIEIVATKQKNEQTHSKYADLKDVLSTNKPIYTAAGFSLMFYEGETQKVGHIRICVDVMHEQGHTETRHLDLAIQTAGIAGKTMMTQIHGEGSAISYGRRYLTCMIFNIPTGDDNDGNAAAKTFITDEQVSELADMLDESGSDIPKFLQYMGVERLGEIQKKQFNSAKSALAIKLKTKGKRIHANYSPEGVGDE